MKPLKIVMSAFCPYAGKTEVDFGAFNGRGLFLVTGDTGAGKTTIFDALSFALFGEASGSSRTVDTLRSDFASPDTATFVELTFEHRGKIYFIRRNPRYERPKKSGDGTTSENADAELILPDGKVITGNRDVNLSVIDILGVNYKQFKQIAMIAQGEFLQLLLADSRERGEIFRKVFNTDLFLSVQNLLKEKEKLLRRSCDDAEKRILQYVREIRAEDDETRVLIEKSDIHNTDIILTRLGELIDIDNAACKKLRDDLSFIDKKLGKQIEMITDAGFVNKLFNDLDEQKLKYKALMLKEQDYLNSKEAFEKGQTALYMVNPLEKTYLKDKEDEQGLIKRIEDLTLNIAKMEPKLKKLQEEYIKQKEKEPVRDKLSANIEHLKNMLPRYDRCDALVKTVNKLGKEADNVISRIEKLKEMKDALDKERKDLSGELESLDSVERDMSDMKYSIDKLKEKYKSLGSLKNVYEDLQKLKKQSSDLKDGFIKAQEEFLKNNRAYVEKEAAFLREQAGVLAIKLNDGQPCPVCGSIDHPHKAVLSETAPSEAELKRLKKRNDELQDEVQKKAGISAGKDGEVNTALNHLEDKIRLDFPDYSDYGKTDLAVLIKASMDDVVVKGKALAFEYEVLEKKSLRKKEIKDRNVLIDEELDLIDKERICDEIRRDEVLKELNSLKGQLDELISSLEHESRKTAEKILKERIKELDVLKDSFLKAETGFNDLKSRLESSRNLLVNFNEQLESIRKIVNEDHSIYMKKIAGSGFEGEASYRDALKTEEQLQELKDAVTDHETSVRDVKREIERLEKEVKDKEKKDLEGLKETKKILDVEKVRAGDLLNDILLRMGINKGVFEKLKIAVLEAGNFQKEYLLYSNLSKTANGELTGKQKIAFEQYVQASYFNRILYEANKRLGIMTNKRYELLRKEENDLRRQTGLEIDVLDNYTGRIRSVKSLSGGESFKASLSLALGLSDVIQSYTGGVEIDTLFIDEGFGALDSESLEQAIQTLAGLTEGNRLVGIISHVSELKERIDRQIVISKSVAGSSIKVV